MNTAAGQLPGRLSTPLSNCACSVFANEGRRRVSCRASSLISRVALLGTPFFRRRDAFPWPSPDAPPDAAAAASYPGARLPFKGLTPLG